MSNPYANMAPAPPSSFAPGFRFDQPGWFVQGTVEAVREFPAEEGNKPILDIRVQESNPAHVATDHGSMDTAGEVVSVICGSRSLHALVMEKQPLPGQVVRIALDSLSGQAKNFSLLVQQGNGAAPAAPAAPPAPAPVVQQAEPTQDAWA